MAFKFLHRDSSTSRMIHASTSLLWHHRRCLLFHLNFALCPQVLHTGHFKLNSILKKLRELKVKEDRQTDPTVESVALSKRLPSPQPRALSFRRSIRCHALLSRSAYRYGKNACRLHSTSNSGVRTALWLLK